MALTMTVLAITASLLLGYWIYLRLGSGTADATYDAIGLISAVFWILAGIFAIMGGFVIVGSVIIIIASYIGFSKGKNTERRVRRRLAG